MNNIVEVINALSEQFGVVIDWSNQNIIPYVQDLISRYAKAEMIKSMVWIIFFVTLIIIDILVTKVIWKNCEGIWNEDDVKIDILIANFFIVGVSAIILTLNILNIIDFGVFPEKMFIDLLLNK